MTRIPLSQRRYAESFDVAFPAFTDKLYAVTVGCYDNGCVGEVFLSSYKGAGGQADLAARDTALLISLALQHGVPLETMVHACVRDEHGNPEGLAGLVLTRLLEWQGAQ